MNDWWCEEGRELVSWSLTSLFSTNMGISETKEWHDAWIVHVLEKVSVAF